MSDQKRIIIPYDMLDCETNDFMNDPFRLKCNHVYDRSHLEKIIGIYKSGECPLCKRVFTKSTMKPDVGVKAYIENFKRRNNINITDS